MKVKEFLEKLAKEDPEANIYTYVHGNGGGSFHAVTSAQPLTEELLRYNFGGEIGGVFIQ